VGKIHNKEEKKTHGRLESKIKDPKFLKLYKFVEIGLATKFYDQKGLSTDL